MSEKEFAEKLQDDELSSELEQLENAQEEHDPNEPEKTLPVSRVTKLIQKAKFKGEKKMAQELEAAKQQIEQLQTQQQAQPQQAAMGGMQQQQQQAPQFDPQQMQQQIMQQIQAEMQKKQQAEQQAQIEQEVAKVAEQYYAKMAQGKDQFDDFDAITADFDPAAFPQLVFLANETDNTAAVIYELKKNPTKLATLATLIERSPQMARAELAKLSGSIKTNQEALAGAKTANDPLSRLKPSQAGTASDKYNSVADYKSAPWLRG